MRKICYVTLVGLVTLGVSTPTIGDVGVPLPGGSGVNNAVKTPLLETSDTWTTSIDIHNAFTITNWAGYVVAGQVTDPNEVVLFPCTLGDGTVVYPGGGGSVGGAVWGTAASASGVTLSASSNVPIMIALVLHAINTNSSGNDSQYDLYVDGWNIRHAISSSMVVLRADKDMVWAPSTWDPGTIPSEFEWPYPPLPPGAPDGHFVTVPYSCTKHVPVGYGSNFYATLAGKATIDVQHVPEPAMGALVLGGVACLLMGRRARRRRLTQ